MAEVNNPHDKFFKRLFGKLATAADFFRNYLPAEVVAALDLDTLALEKESFIDPKLRGHFSDLLYRVRLRAGGELFIYLLLEHKSAPDTWVAFQVLRYMVRLWEQLYEQGVARLPLIIPIVFYHGEERWHVSRQFNALVEAGGEPALQRYAPALEYDLQDVSQRGAVEIKGEPRLRTGLALLRHIFSDDLGQRLPGIFRHLRELRLADALEFLQSILVYLASTARKIQNKEIAIAMEEAIPREELGRVAIFAQEWIEEGEQIGMQKGMAGMALRQARHRFGQLDADTEEQIRALPSHLLEEFGEAVIDFASLAELQQWLVAQSTERLVG